MGELPGILSPVELDLLEESFPCRAYHSQSVYGIVETDGDGRVCYSLDPRFLRARRVHDPLTTVLHPHSVCNDNSINATGCHNVILLAPSQALYFP